MNKTITKYIREDIIFILSSTFLVVIFTTKALDYLPLPHSRSSDFINSFVSAVFFSNLLFWAAYNYRLWFLKRPTIWVRIFFFIANSLLIILALFPHMNQFWQSAIYSLLVFNLIQLFYFFGRRTKYNKLNIVANLFFIAFIIAQIVSENLAYTFGFLNKNERSSHVIYEKQNFDGTKDIVVANKVEGGMYITEKIFFNDNGQLIKYEDSNPETDYQTAKLAVSKDIDFYTNGKPQSIMATKWFITEGYYKLKSRKFISFHDNGMLHTYKERDLTAKREAVQFSVYHPNGYMARTGNEIYAYSNSYNNGKWYWYSSNDGKVIDSILIDRMNVISDAQLDSIDNRYMSNCYNSCCIVDQDLVRQQILKNNFQHVKLDSELYWEAIEIGKKYKLENYNIGDLNNYCCNHQKE